MENNQVLPSVGENLLTMTAKIVAAYAGNHAVASSEIPDLIRSVHSALASLSGHHLQHGGQSPAVAINKSIMPGYLICLEDGKKLKMLKRYLRSNYSMTPAEYRLKWGLPADYPMVAPNYSRQRSAFAKKSGLGRQSRPAG